jgi:hypothetical protein
MKYSGEVVWLEDKEAHLGSVHAIIESDFIELKWRYPEERERVANGKLTDRNVYVGEYDGPEVRGNFELKKCGTDDELVLFGKWKSRTSTRHGRWVLFLAPQQQNE